MSPDLLLILFCHWFCDIIVVKKLVLLNKGISLKGSCHNPLAWQAARGSQYGFQLIRKSLSFSRSGSNPTHV